MLKNAYFLEKTVKNRLSVEGSAPKPPFASGGSGLRPQTPRCYHRLLLQLCQVHFRR